MSDIGKNKLLISELKLELESLLRERRKLVKELDNKDTKIIGLKLKIEKLEGSHESSYTESELNHWDED